MEKWSIGKLLVRGVKEGRWGLAASDVIRVAGWERRTAAREQQELLDTQAEGLIKSGPLK